MHVQMAPQTGYYLAHGWPRLRGKQCGPYGKGKNVFLYYSKGKSANQKKQSCNNDLCIYTLTKYNN